jgi:hypothetical protein
MKYSFLFIIVASLSLTNCSTKVDIVAPHKDIAVTYCLLDINSHQHYVKINRLTNGSTDANSLIKIQDSIYFDDTKLQVYLVAKYEVNFKQVSDSIRMEKTTDIPKTNDPFYSGQNILYTNKDTLDPKCTLSASKQYFVHAFYKNKLISSGTTKLIKEVNIQDAHFGESTQKILGVTISEDAMRSTKTINYFTKEDAQIYMNSGCIFQCRFRFYYYEVPLPIQPTLVFSQLPAEYRKHIDWYRQTTNYSPYDSFTLNDMIDNCFKKQLSDNPNVVRYIRSEKAVQLILYVGSSEIYEYMKNQLPMTTVNQDKIQLTTMQVGLGLMASRTVTRDPQYFKMQPNPDGIRGVLFKNSTLHFASPSDLEHYTQIDFNPCN